ncbi:MAG TPA: Calx-beta domain-containing protein [Thermoanaerobaculia bacterium]
MLRFPVLALVTLLATNAFGATLLWTGAVDNRWSTAGNWSPAQVPVDGDTLRFLNPSPNANLLNDLNVSLERIHFESTPYTIGGNPVRVRSHIADGGCVATFTAPVEAEGPIITSAASYSTLEVNNQTITLIRCDFNGSITGHGTVIVYDAIRVNGTHPFTGQVFDGVSGFELAGSLSNASFRVSHELAGNGSAGTVDAYGRIAPGARATNDTGTLTTRDIALRGSAFAPEELGAYIVDINGGGHDQLAVNGTVLIENKPLELRLPDNFNPALNTTYVIVANDGGDPISGTFGRLLPSGEIEPLPEGATFNAGRKTFRITYTGGTGNDVAVRVQPQRVATKVNAFYGAAETGRTFPIDVLVETDPAGGAINSGTVTIREGSTILGSAQVSENRAQVLVGPLSRGVHTLTVEYSGDETHLGSSTNIFVDVIAPQSMISIADVSRSEGNVGNATVDVVVTMSSSALFPITVDYATGGGTATPGVDYLASSGTLTFAPGQSTRRITLTIVSDDVREADETFFVTLSNATGGVLTDATAVVTILNDDQSGTFHRDVEFARPNGIPLRMDLLVPFGPGPHPLLIVVEANDWAAPRRNSTPAGSFGTRYATAWIDFRPTTLAQFPAQVSDVKSAIRYLRAFAWQYGLDTSRFGLMGIGAAGGHLASLAGMTADAAPDDLSGGNWGYSSRVRAVVDLGGATDLLQAGGSCIATDSITQFLGCSPFSCAGTARFASPTSHATTDDPVFFISGDCAAQGELLRNALRAAGVEATIGDATAVEPFLVENLVEVPRKGRAVRR